MTKLAINKSTLQVREILTNDVKANELFAEVESEFASNARFYLKRIAETQMNRSDENRAACIEEFLSNCKTCWTSEYQARFN